MWQFWTFYMTKVKCPVCEKDFTTKKVTLSKLRLVKQDADYRQYDDEENQIKYSIFVCPHCGYSATEDKYDSIAKRNKDVVLNEISLKWNKRDYGDKRTIEESIESYKLAIYIGQLLEYINIELGQLTLNLAWLYRLKGDEEQEMRF